MSGLIRLATCIPSITKSNGIPFSTTGPVRDSTNKHQLLCGSSLPDWRLIIAGRPHDDEAYDHDAAILALRKGLLTENTYTGIFPSKAPGKCAPPRTGHVFLAQPAAAISHTVDAVWWFRSSSKSSSSSTSDSCFPPPIPSLDLAHLSFARRDQSNLVPA